MSKRLKKHFKNSITSILILSIFSIPFLSITKVYAQERSGGYTTGGAYPTDTQDSQITGGIGAYIQVLGPAIQELPLCKDKISTNGIKNLFKNTDAIKKSGESLPDLTSKLGTDDDVGLFEDSLPVRDAKAVEQNKEILTSQKETEKKISSLEENDTCLKSIGRMVIKMLLQKITVSTVEWINNGFEGKPLFLQNAGKFFGDIATNEILQFRLEIDNPTLYPFGRNFLKSQVGILTNRFAQNARYSANELIQRTTPEYSSTTFSTNFSQGGWNAWRSLTQVPANNPLGFNIIASNELSLRLEGTSASTAEKAQTALNQSGGFLGDERCADPQGITREQHRAALVKGERTKIKVPHYVDLEEGANNPDTAEIEYIEIDDPNGEVVGLCKRWEYVTPGKLIAEAATKVVNYPDNNLLKADDLNSAIASVMDALLNRWSQDLANKGFASFSNEGATGSFILDGNNRTTGGTQQVYLDFPSSAIRSNWLRENADFNIRTDLTQALIDEQRIYQRKLLEQNEILADLTTTVHQLDYCIPGPNPNYVETGERVLNAVINSIPSKTATDFEKSSASSVNALIQTTAAIAGTVIAATVTSTSVILGLTVGAAAGPVGAAIGLAIGVLAQVIVTSLANQPHKLVDKYYAGIMGGLTGLHLSKPNTDKAEITGKQDITIALDKMFVRYVQLIKHYYTSDFLPTITPAAKIEFRKIDGYLKKAENNEYASTQLEGIIVRLAKLKDDLDKLDPNVNSYSDYLPFINEFARLSGSMVTGNDIAKVVDENLEYGSQIKYVYDDLLTGDFGCEKDLMEQKQEPTSASATSDKRFKLRQTQRAEYPFKLWYDYNKLAPNEPIPNVPELNQYNSGINKTETKMPDYVIGPLGPGFLSSVAMNYRNPNKKSFMSLIEASIKATQEEGDIIISWGSGNNSGDVIFEIDRNGSGLLVGSCQPSGQCNGQWAGNIEDSDGDDVRGGFEALGLVKGEFSGKCQNVLQEIFTDRPFKCSGNWTGTAETDTGIGDGSGQGDYLDKTCPSAPSFIPNILDCLFVGDLFLNVNAWPVSVGRNQGLPLSGETGAHINQQKDTSFEQTIGIY